MFIALERIGARFCHCEAAVPALTVIANGEVRRALELRVLFWRVNLNGLERRLFEGERQPEGSKGGHDVGKVELGADL